MGLARSDDRANNVRNLNLAIFGNALALDGDRASVLMVPGLRFVLQQFLHTINQTLKPGVIIRVGSFEFLFDRFQAGRSIQVRWAQVLHRDKFRISV